MYKRRFFTILVVIIFMLSLYFFFRILHNDMMQLLIKDVREFNSICRTYASKPFQFATLQNSKAYCYVENMHTDGLTSVGTKPLTADIFETCMRTLYCSDGTKNNGQCDDRLSHDKFDFTLLQSDNVDDNYRCILTVSKSTIQSTRLEFLSD